MNPMSNDVEIRVRTTNQADGFTSVNTQLTALKTVAGNAAQSLRTLTTRSGAASLSLKNVKTSAGDARTALEELRAQAGDVTVKAKIRDDTRAGADAVKAAVDDLKTLGPVALDVRFNGSSADILATADAMKDLKSNARDAGQSTQTLGSRASAAAVRLEELKVAAEGAADKIGHLRTNAAEAAVAVGELRDRAARAATAVGSLRDRATAAGTRVDALAGNTRTLRTDLDGLTTSATRASGGLNGLRGRIASTGSSGDRASGALEHLKGALISLAPAAVPVAAAMTPIVTATGAAVLALAALGAAIIPQVSQLSDLSHALDTVSAAQESGAAMSKQAVAKYDEALSAVEGTPVATRKAAAAWGDLTQSFKSWSNSLSGFTMDPVTKSFAVFEQVLPRLSPLVKDSSAQLSRLVTLAGGEVSTPGFDALMGKLDTYTNRVLKGAVDETVHFSRVLSEGGADGPVSKFMEYARSEGPQVKQVLSDLATTVGHLLQAASEAGPGLLTVVDALARLINAVPPELLGRLMQLYTTFKLVKLAGAGLTSITGGVQSLATRLTALNAASAAAGGGLAGVRAALASLSTGTKITGAVAVIAGLVLALKSLGGSGSAAPNVERMTTAIGQLGRTGKVSGEASRVFGKDFDDLNYAIGRLNGRRSGMDAFNDSMNAVFTLGFGKSNSAKKAAKDIDAVDQSLADLVQNGQADIAAAALKRLTDEYTKTGKPATDLTKKLDAYQSALDDAQFEQDLAADSMGLFGQQAVDVQAKLDAQTKSADGLRQSIQALNQENRSALDAEADFEQAIDDATAAIKGHHHALTMANGELNLNSQAARDAYKPLSDLAAKTDAATAAAREQGQSWQQVNEIYGRGREALIRTATQMGLTTAQARQLADQILKTPDKTAYLKGNIQDLQAKLNAAKASLKGVPASKTAAIKANIAQLQNAIRDAQSRVNNLHGKTVPIIVKTTYVTGVGNVAHEGGGYAHGGIVGAAAGGPRSRLTLVGEQGPELVDLAAGSRVRSANATRQLVAQATSGSGVARVELAFVGGSDDFSRAMVTLLQSYVQPRGGNVQVAVMGRAG
ncbi:hypothetical protein VSR01_10780 [Actinacidiphila sp. DG2A-62]|uniref:hypothetical protein n=1 Tax=Actinacidiphila sp. DG2A-62 TaxID=3108821 RepID=UPI002DB75845|nr:hypothetical protein [Actinacidiphila sp. DG2A-62]MEC3994003.1 hypothetical protein [Actinacidiphila sp. DG2A-62]